MIIRLCLVYFLIFLYACAAPGIYTSSYEDPLDYYIGNEVQVNASPDVVWDKLVHGLSKSYFVINNIDKESRIINLSFYSDDAAQYIDCGNTIIDTTITIPPPKKIHTQFKYRTCESSFYVVGDSVKNAIGEEFPIVRKIDRKAQVEGRMNIYVAPSGDGTLVTVNCRYILTVDTSLDTTVYNISGNPISHDNRSSHNTCAFNTKRLGMCLWRTGDDRSEIKCTSIGALEREILRLVKAR